MTETERGSFKNKLEALKDWANDVDLDEEVNDSADYFSGWEDEEVPESVKAVKKSKKIDEDIEYLDEEDLETRQVRKPKTKKVEKVSKDEVEKTSSGFFASIRNAFHGFFVITAFMALATAIYIYFAGSTEIVTIQLPAIQISHFRMAVAALILLVILAVGTSKNKD